MPPNRTLTRRRFLKATTLRSTAVGFVGSLGIPARAGTDADHPTSLKIGTKKNSAFLYGAFLYSAFLYSAFLYSAFLYGAFLHGAFLHEHVQMPRG